MQWDREDRIRIRLVNPVTLIVAVCVDDKIVIGADGLLCWADKVNNLNPTFATNKLWSIRKTNWTLACAGSDMVGVFCKRIDAEVELGQRVPFDPHLEVGGPDYINALTALTSEAKMVAPDWNMLPTTVLLAGFDLRKAPYLLQTQLPLGGYFASPGGCAILGAQDAIVWWLLRVLVPCCKTIDSVEKLICFTIWQASKRDLRIGRAEAGFPISLCVMEADKPIQYERFERAAVDAWMQEWEVRLQANLMATINAMETSPPKKAEAQT